MSYTDGELRAAAARALACFKDPEAVRALTGALRDEDEWVRLRAAEALAWIGDCRAVPALMSALNDTHTQIGQIRRNNVRPSARDFVPDPVLSARPQNSRSAAAWALGKLGDSRAVEALRAALLNDDQDTRKHAAEALALICKTAQREQTP